MLEIDVFSREIAFGLTPFETVYVEKLFPHLLEQHYNRMKRACAVLHIKFQLEYTEFKAGIEDYLQKLCFDEGVLKIAVKDGKLLYNTRAPSYNRSDYERGLNIRFSKVTRNKNNIFNHLKTFNYGMNYIEDIRAKKRGFDTCLFLNEEKNICETAYANIFFRKGSALYVPHLSTGILIGIMRQEVLKYAKRNSYDVIKWEFGTEKLSNFEECFITNSVAGVFPVAAIEDYKFGSRSFAGSINKEPGFERAWNKYCGIDIHPRN